MIKFGICWLHPLYSQEREACADRSLVYHSFRETQWRSSHFRERAGKLAALFSRKKKSGQDTFSDRDGTSSGQQRVQGKGETLVRFSNREETARLALEELTPTKKTQCQVHLTSEQVQGDLQQCSHTEENRVKSHIPTEKEYPRTSSSSRRKLGSIQTLWIGKCCETSP